MSDYFLSYGHEDRERAIGIRQRLAAAGQVVWLDAPDDDLEGPVGVPAGSRHRPTIEAAIRAALAFVVLDSQDWRDSDYCRWELEVARDLGKVIAVLSPTVAEGRPDTTWSETSLAGPEDLVIPAPDDCDGLIAQTLDGRHEAQSHTRLVDSETTTQSRLRDILRGVPLVDDAQVVLGMVGGVGRPHPPTAVRELAAHLILRDQRRRALLRRSLSSIIAALVILAASAGALGLAAAAHRQAAVASAATARSMELANDSLLQPNHASSGLLAETALRVDDNASSRSASAMALADAQTFTRSDAPSRPYVSGDVSNDGRLAVFSYGTGASVFTGSGDFVGEVNFDKDVGASPIVLDDIGQMVSLGPGSPSHPLVRMSLQDGYLQRSWTDEDFTALAKGTDGRIWWGAASGKVGFISGDQVVTALTTGGPVTAVDATLTGLVVASNHTTVHRYALPLSSDPAPEWTRNLGQTVFPPTLDSGPDAKTNYSRPPAADATSPAPATGNPSDQAMADYRRLQATPLNFGFPDVLRTCSTTVHILLSTRLAQFPAAVHTALDESTGAVLMPAARQSPLRGQMCQADGTLLGGAFMSNQLAVAPERRWTPVGVMDDADRFTRGTVLAANAAGTRAMLVHATGAVDVMGPAPVTSRELNDSIYVTPTPEGYLTQDVTGELWMVPLAAGSARRVGVQLPRVGIAARSGPTCSLAWSRPTVYCLSGRGVVRQWTLSGNLADMRFSQDGTVVDITQTDGTLFQARLDSDATTRVTVPGLDSRERVISAASAGSRILVATNTGRLVAFDRGSSTVAAQILDGGTTQTISAIHGPQPGFVAVGRDGMLRRLGPELTVERTAYVRDCFDTLETSWDGAQVVAAGATAVVILGTADLVQTQSTPSMVPMRTWPQFAPDSRTLVSFSPWLVSGDGAMVDSAPYVNGGPRGVKPAVLTDNQDLWPAVVTVVPVCSTCRPASVPRQSASGELGTLTLETASHAEQTLPSLGSKPSERWTVALNDAADPLLHGATPSQVTSIPGGFLVVATIGQTPGDGGTPVLLSQVVLIDAGDGHTRWRSEVLPGFSTCWAHPSETWILCGSSTSKDKSTAVLISQETGEVLSRMPLREPVVDAVATTGGFLILGRTTFGAGSAVTAYEVTGQGDVRARGTALTEFVYGPTRWLQDQGALKVEGVTSADGHALSYDIAAGSFVVDAERGAWVASYGTVRRVAVDVDHNEVTVGDSVGPAMADLPGSADAWAEFNLPSSIVATALMESEVSTIKRMWRIESGTAVEIRPGSGISPMARCGDLILTSEPEAAGTDDPLSKVVVRAWDLSMTREIWQRSMPLSTVDLCDGRHGVTSGIDGSLIGFAVSDGTELWRSPADQSLQNNGISLVGGYLIKVTGDVGSGFSSHLSLLSATT